MIALYVALVHATDAAVAALAWKDTAWVNPVATLTAVAFTDEPTWMMIAPVAATLLMASTQMLLPAFITTAVCADAVAPKVNAAERAYAAIAEIVVKVESALTDADADNVRLAVDEMVVDEPNAAVNAIDN